jgi:hypothetical protein
MTRNAPSEYRLYCLDALGRIGMAEWIDAENDQDAIQQAQLLKRDAMKCEIWNGSRLVARLDADDLAASLASRAEGGFPASLRKPGVEYEEIAKAAEQRNGFHCDPRPPAD